MKTVSAVVAILCLCSQTAPGQAVDSLLSVHRAQLEAGRPAEALATVAAAEVLAGPEWGESHPKYAECLYGHGLALFLLERSAEAETLFRRSLSIREAALGHEHPECVRTLAALGKALGKKGDFAAGEEKLLEAKAICARTDRTADAGYADLLSSCSYFYFHQGAFEKARTHSLESLALRERLGLTADRGYANELQSLAMIANRLGDYPTAGSYFTRAVAAFEQATGTQHPAYAACLLDFAINFQLQNEFEKAEKLYVRSLEITAATIGSDHLEYAQNLEGLGHLYIRMGNAGKARALYLEGLGIRERILGKDHPEYGVSLLGLAGYYFSIGDLVEAERNLIDALGIVEKTLGKDHPYSMTAMLNLSMLFDMQGKYEQARPMMVEVSELLRKNLGERHPNYAASLMNLGLLQTNLGEYGEADRNLQQARLILEEATGKIAHQYDACLDALITLKRKSGQDREALAYIHEMGGLQKSLILRDAQHLSEREMDAYLATFASYCNRHFSTLHALAPAPGTATAQAFDDALFYKGYLLNHASRVKEFTINDPALAARYDELTALQMQLAAEYAQPPAARSGVAGLEDRANAIEKELLSSVAGYEELFRQVSWREVQQNLQPREAAVEFVRFESLAAGEWSDHARYAAIVLRAGTEYPAFVPLLEEALLVKKMNSGGSDRTGAVNELYRFDEKRPEEALYRLLWQPIEPVLGDAATIYFSPAGLLHRLNLAAVHDGQGRVLADRYALVKLGSTRQLSLPVSSSSGANTATLFGGIVYEPDSEASAVPEKAPPASADLAGRHPGSPDSTVLRLRGAKWEYLDWTQTEVETIGLLTEAAGIATVTLTGRAASEEAFKNLGRSGNSPRILHLATHGYFFPDPARQSLGEGGPLHNDPAFETSEHPMIRSGLLLAGANYAWKNGRPISPGADDGILTAYEIAQLDLSQTELVVLSACETGLGDIRGDEGVYGLQRAFKLAGVKYVLMSLWQVPDFQTQELMAAFYYHFLEEKMDIPAALRAAQAELRSRYPDPFTWAGFVLLE